MKRVAIMIGSACLGCAVIAAAATFLARNLRTGQEIPYPVPPTLSRAAMPDGITLAEGVELRFVEFAPVYPDRQVYVTESPITNAEYAVGIREKKISPPELPPELRPGGGTSGAAWAEIAWVDGTLPKGKENDVVLFVNDDDANAFCRWLEEKTPEYRFRLPRSLETQAWHDDVVQLNPRVMERDSAFSRPARGKGAERIHGRFWAAPWTRELIDLDAPPFIGDPEGKGAYLFYFRLRAAEIRPTRRGFNKQRECSAHGFSRRRSQKKLVNENVDSCASPG